jgi:hypothetical protein
MNSDKLAFLGIITIWLGSIAFITYYGIAIKKMSKATKQLKNILTREER